jgi:hypothetical protein
MGTGTCIKDRTFLATASGWSLARRSRVARKFLHLILAVSGVICCPMVLLNIIGKVFLKIQVYNFGEKTHEPAWRIRDVHPGSRIQDPTTEPKEGEKFVFTFHFL